MDATKVGIGKPQVGGAVYTAPNGTEVPTDGTSAMSGHEGFKELGYASDSGLTNNISETHTDIKAWGGDIVASPLEEVTETFTITMIETSEDVAKEYFGYDNVTNDGKGNLVIKSTAVDKVDHPWVFDTLLNEETKERIVVPRGKVTELGELAYVDGSPVGYPLTIKALPDSAGVRAYRYVTVKEGV